MKLSQNDRILRKKLYIALAATGVVLYSLYCFLLLPAYYTTLNDIAYVDAVPIALEYLFKIVEVLAMSCFCGITVYGIFRLGAGAFGWGYVIFCALSFYKYFGNLVADWLFYGSIDLINLASDLLSSCLLAVIEILPFVIVFLIVRSIINNYRSEAKILKKAGVEKSPLPYAKLFDLSNCLLSSAFVCALLVLITKLGGMLVSDLSYVLTGGLPTEFFTVAQMLLNYSVSIIFAALCYFVMIFGMSFISEKLDASE